MNTTIVLDHEEKISIDRSWLFLSRFHALNYLRGGLFYLSSKIKILEGKRSSVVLYFGGGIPPFVFCAFHWFSISLSNYVRLIGLIDIMKKENLKIEDFSDIKIKRKISKSCGDYAQKVIPDIVKWRNKISAHFAITDPYGEDNIATLEQSIMNTIVIYHKPRFQAGIKWHSKGEESQLPKWSLTEVYEQLSTRYWPNSKLGFTQEECIPPDEFSLIPE